MKQKMIKVILPLLILAAGFIGMRALVLSKTPPSRKAHEDIGTLVSTVTVQPADYPVEIQATGTVKAAQSVAIIPEVSGKIVWINPHFEEGGFFRKGEVLFRIDDTDCRLAVEKSKAGIAKAEYELANVTSQARVARREWEQVNLADKEEPNPLVLYEPQMKNAQATLASARADLRKCLLDVKRTKITAPFNARIKRKQVDTGQFVAVGQQTAILVATDLAEIIVPVSLNDLQWLKIPKQDGGKGSAAVIQLTAGRKSFTWNGWVDRSMGEVDTAGRMMRVIVQVEDPYGLTQKKDQEFDLVEGLFVAVSIQGRPLRNVLPIPNGSLRYGQTIWGIAPDNTLRIDPVEVLRREKDTVLVRGKVNGTYRLVTTNISGAAKGMRLRIVKEVKS